MNKKIDIEVIKGHINYLEKLYQRKVTDFEAEIKPLSVEIEEMMNYYVHIRYPLIVMNEVIEDHGAAEHKLCEKVTETLSQIKEELMTLFKKCHSYSTITKEKYDYVLKNYNKGAPGHLLNKYHKVLETVYTVDHTAIFMAQYKEKINNVLEILYYFAGIYDHNRKKINQLYNITGSNSNMYS